MSQISTTSYIKLLKNSGINSFLQDKPNNLYETKIIQNNSQASKQIEDINSIEDLKIFIKNSSICSLKKNAKSSVFNDGNQKAKIMIIGDLPEPDDDKIGIPFSGKSGQLLEKMLNAIKLKKEDVYLTNVIPWITPGGRIPTNGEILECLPFVQRHIEIISPKIIILLGDVAAKAILNSNLKISELRGKWHEYKSINFNKKNSILVTYHPTFLLNNQHYKKNTWEDLKMLKIKIIDENL